MKPERSGIYKAIPPTIAENQSLYDQHAYLLIHVFFLQTHAL